MKKVLYFGFCLLMTLGMSVFSSCGEDDDEIDIKPVEPIVTDPVKNTTWMTTESFSDGTKLITSLSFGETTARMSFTAVEGTTSSTTTIDYTFVRSSSLIVLTPTENGRAILECTITDDIKMTVKNMSNNSQIAVLYKQ